MCLDQESKEQEKEGDLEENNHEVERKQSKEF